MFDYQETVNRIEFALKSYIKETSIGFVKLHAHKFHSLVSELWDLHEASANGGGFDSMRYQELSRRMRNANQTGLTAAEEMALAATVCSLYECSVASVAINAPFFDGIDVLLYINKLLVTLDAAAEMQINGIIEDIPCDVFA